MSGDPVGYPRFALLSFNVFIWEKVRKKISFADFTAELHFFKRRLVFRGIPKPSSSLNQITAGKFFWREGLKMHLVQGITIQYKEHLQEGLKNLSPYYIERP